MKSFALLNLVLLLSLFVYTDAAAYTIANFKLANSENRFACGDVLQFSYQWIGPCNNATGKDGLDIFLQDAQFNTIGYLGPVDCMLSFFIWEIPARGLSAYWAMDSALSNQFYALANAWDSTYDGPEPGRSLLFQIDCPVEPVPRPNFSLEYLTDPAAFKCLGYQYCPCFFETPERSKCWYNLPCDDAGTMTCDAPALIEGCSKSPGSIGCACPCKSVVGLNNVRCVQNRCVITSGTGQTQPSLTMRTMTALSPATTITLYPQTTRSSSSSSQSLNNNFTPQPTPSPTIESPVGPTPMKVSRGGVAASSSTATQQQQQRTTTIVTPAGGIPQTTAIIIAVVIAIVALCLIGFLVEALRRMRSSNSSSNNEMQHVYRPDDQRPNIATIDGESIDAEIRYGGKPGGEGMYDNEHMFGVDRSPPPQTPPYPDGPAYNVVDDFPSVPNQSQPIVSPFVSRDNPPNMSPFVPRDRTQTNWGLAGAAGGFVNPIQNTILRNASVVGNNNNNSPISAANNYANDDL